MNQKIPIVVDRVDTEIPRSVRASKVTSFYMGVCRRELVFITVRMKQFPEMAPRYMKKKGTENQCWIPSRSGRTVE